MSNRVISHGIRVRLPLGGVTIFASSHRVRPATRCQSGAGSTVGRPLSARAVRWVSAAAFSLALVAAGGCGTWAQRDAEPPSTPVPEAQAPEPAVEADIATAIQYMEAGKGRQARQMLKALTKNSPGSNVLKNLLRQIEAPAEELLPGPYREVEVGPGDSLSLIATRELDDPLMFYALARLNGIKVPARIPVGTVLKVPDTTGGEAEPNAAPVEATEAPSEISASEIESFAEYLSRSGQGDQARAMLFGELRGGGGVDSTRDLLARLILERAEALREEARYIPALAIIDDALTVLEAPDRRSSLVEKRERIRSEMLIEAARRLRAQGELVEAYETATTAAGLDQATTDATALVADLRVELVESLHNDALLAWRDRDVDFAIRTWQSLLESVPDFEPARIYLERARLLRERLDQP